MRFSTEIKSHTGLILFRLSCERTLQVRTTGDFSFPTAKVEGQLPNSLSLQLTPPFKEGCSGKSDGETETHPRC